MHPGLPVGDGLDETTDPRGHDGSAGELGFEREHRQSLLAGRDAGDVGCGERAAGIDAPGKLDRIARGAREVFQEGAVVPLATEQETRTRVCGAELEERLDQLALTLARTQGCQRQDGKVVGLESERVTRLDAQVIEPVGEVFIDAVVDDVHAILRHADLRDLARHGRGHGHDGRDARTVESASEPWTLDRVVHPPCDDDRRCPRLAGPAGKTELVRTRVGEVDEVDPLPAQQPPEVAGGPQVEAAPHRNPVDDGAVRFGVLCERCLGLEDEAVLVPGGLEGAHHVQQLVLSPGEAAFGDDMEHTHGGSLHAGYACAMHGSPLDIEGIQSSFDGEVRLFPLPNLVLFPDAFAPLKVFEDRYIKLVEDAIEDDNLIALALLKDGWEEDYAGNPEIHPTVCVGKILRQRRLPSGKFDVLLYGLFRARIVEELGTYPYRRAQVEVVSDVVAPMQVERIARRVRRALDLVPGRRSVIYEMRRMANQLRGVDAGPGRYADAVANASDLQHDARYELLSEPDVLRRLERLIGLLEARAYQDAPSAPPGTRPDLN